MDAAKAVPGVNGFVRGIVAVPGVTCGLVEKAVTAPSQSPLPETTTAVDELPAVKVVGP